MPLCNHGKLQTDLDSLVEGVQCLSDDSWAFRGDPESHETKTIRYGSEFFEPVKDLVDKTLDDCIAILGTGYFNRIVLSCVPAGKQILPHTDDFGEEIRKISIHCHIPLITHPFIKMGFGEEGKEQEFHLKAGYLYSMDETIRHYVNNPSDIDRIHLLFAHFKQ